MSAAPLTGQVAVVTGASRGIGRAVAVHLASQGAAVAGIARASPHLAALPHDAHRAAGHVMGIAADVTSPAEVEAAFARVDAELGTPNVVVACAGTADVIGPLWLADPEQWWQAVAVDLRGTMLTAQCAVTRMLAAGRGRLVTTYGNLGDRQQGDVSALAVAKAGIARLTESLACELAGTEVRVLGVHPGFVRTPMTEQLAQGEQGRAWLPASQNRQYAGGGTRNLLPTSSPLLRSAQLTSSPGGSCTRPTTSARCGNNAGPNLTVVGSGST
jgi:NAD(P)-dependent dehydrogenase (short-subunit alcohol dehydrogenase family)